MNKPLEYETLLAMRNAYILRCVASGLDPQGANEYFTKRAEQLGWIEKVDKTV